jgi:hypothetical protein
MNAIETKTEDSRGESPLPKRPTTAREVLDLLKPRKHCRMTVSLRGARDAAAPSYAREMATFDLTVSFEASGRDHSQGLTRRTVECPGSIGNGYGSGKIMVERRGDFGGYWKFDDAPFNLFEARSGFWYLGSKEDYLRDILAGVPAASAISFHVTRDICVAGALAEAGVHVDHLYVHALVAHRPRRGSRQTTRAFLLDAYAGPHNAARFGVNG